MTSNAPVKKYSFEETEADDEILEWQQRSINNNTNNNTTVEVYTKDNTYEKDLSIYLPDEPIITTEQLAKMQHTAPSLVHHECEWGGVMDLSKNSKKWRFTGDRTVVEKGKDVFTVEIFSPETAATLIKLTEIYGYEDCGYPKHYRTNTRTITNDPSLAARLYTNVHRICKKTLEYDDEKWEICGLNERFRWCKYIGGQKFGQHCDARFNRNMDERSFYTVNIYLNDGTKEFTGGRTCFFNADKKNYGWVESASVTGKPGVALIFNHYPKRYEHNGELVKDGLKYIMRTDVMYKRVTDGKKNVRNFFE